MSADAVAAVLVALAAPPLTVFPFAYAVLSRGLWWRSIAGWALMFSTTGLALLVDISLAYQLFGDDYPFRDEVRLSVYSIILAGAWLKLIALFYESWRGRRDQRRALVPNLDA